MVDSNNDLVKTQIIHQILDIDPGIQKQNSYVTQVLNNASVNFETEMTNEQYFELQQNACRPRKRNQSTGSENSTEAYNPFGKKDEVICIEIGDTDSLVKLALKYCCTVAELKNINKIYNETELHAKKTIKIPVFKNGEIYDSHLKSLNEKESHGSENKTSNAYRNGEVDSKYKFCLQKQFQINKDLDYMSSDEGDLVLDSENETSLLLEDRTNYKHIPFGQPIDGCDEPFQQFIDRMDQELEKNISEVQSKKTNLEEVVNAMTTPIVFVPGAKEIPEQYGSICSVGWKTFCFLICLIAVVLPLLYLLYFYGKHKK